MVTATVRRVAVGETSGLRVGDDHHPKLVLATEDDDSVLVVPYAPREVDMDGIGEQWETADRAGRRPLLVRSGSKLPRMRWTMFVAHRDHQRSIELILATLKRLAESGQRVRVIYGPMETTWWRLTDVAWRTLMRQHGTNRVTRAEVDVEFQRVSDAKANTGPLTGGAQRRDSDPPGSPRTHTVQAGDTYWKLADRYYGNGAEWRTIADANPYPPRAIPVGVNLTIPASSGAASQVVTLKQEIDRWNRQPDSVRLGRGVPADLARRVRAAGYTIFEDQSIGRPLA